MYSVWYEDLTLDCVIYNIKAVTVLGNGPLSAFSEYYLADYNGSWDSCFCRLVNNMIYCRIALGIVIMIMDNDLGNESCNIVIY